MLQSLESEAHLRPLLGLEMPELRSVLGPGQPAFRARQLFEALYRHQLRDLSYISTFPQVLREQLLTRFTAGFPAL